MSLSGFGITVMVTSQSDLRSVPSSSVFWKSLRRISKNFPFLKLLLFFLLYNIVLVLPYINMHPPRAYTCSPSWIPLLPSSPSHPSRSSQCTSPKHPVSCIKPGLTIRFTYDNIHSFSNLSHIFVQFWKILKYYFILFEISFREILRVFDLIFF